MTIAPRSSVVIVSVLLAILAVTAAAPVASAAGRRPTDAQRWIVAVARADGSAIGPRGAIGPAPRLRPVPGDPAGHREVLRLLRSGGIRPSVVYRHAFDGFAAVLTRSQVAALRRDPAVTVMLPDRATRVDDAPASAIPRFRLEDPVVPTGIRRVRADRGPLSRIDGVDERLDVDVAIIDTGIAPSPELDIEGGFDCSSDDPAAWRDREGHGTHVAGTVAARDDGRGVVGVAPGARLWAIKIFDDNGYGLLSQELCGFDHVLGMRDPDDPSRPRIEVINLSIGQWLAGYDDRDCGRPSGDLVHGAICALVADGTVVVAAAGNQSVDAATRQPAAYDEVITVSALADFDGLPGGRGDQRDTCPGYSLDTDDTFGNFSNYGADVDIIAPGKCILSTLPGGHYGISTGTSMATPHVSGAAALVAATYPGASPGQIRSALLGAATDDWVTRTDPDRWRDPLLDVSRLGDLPDLAITPGLPSDELARGGLTRIDVAIERSGGLRGPIDVRVPGLPDGLTAEVAPTPTRGDTVAVWLRAGESAPDGPLDITIRATDGDLVRTATATVRIRAEGPVIAFTAPEGGAGDPLITDDDQLEVTFREQAPGLPPSERRVLRQHGDPSTPGSCRNVDWSAVDSPVAPGELDPDGSAEAGWAFTAGLTEDGCTRWLVRLVDEDGGSAWFASPAVLRDTEDPRSPIVRATGDGVWQGGPGGTVWVRAGSGSLVLAADGRDAASGVVSHQFGPLTDTTGWVYEPGPAGSDSGATIGWTPDATATELEVTAQDATGRVGPARRVRLKVDGTAPRASGWLEPRGTDRPFFSVPELLWRAISDKGTGAATLQRVQRQVASPIARSCKGVSWSDDGPLRSVAPHDQQWDVASGRCYRWILIPVDKVGNAGRRSASGAVLIDLLAPAADFQTPDEGTEVITADSSFSVAWEEPRQGGGGAVRRLLERERVAVQNGACPEIGWQVRGAKSTGPSPSVSTGLKSGWCYRWRLNLADRWDNLSVELSGVVRVEAP
jgi:subtilisin